MVDLFMEMKMNKSILLLFALALAASCGKDNVEGTVNSTDPVPMTTSEWLASQSETKVVAELFDRAGLTDVINSDVTVIAPNVWAVNRYIRRHNSVNRKPAEDPRYTLDSLMNEDLSRMKMYIFPGVWTLDEIPDEGVYLTALDDSTEIRLSYDEVNTDPTAAWDGGNVAGNGYQYSNFLLSDPKVLHVLFKRGSSWELNYLDRSSMGFDNSECDQAYKMYVSNIRTNSGGAVHVLYAGDSAYAEQYYYHSLFFYGTRSDDR